MLKLQQYLSLFLHFATSSKASRTLLNLYALPKKKNAEKIKTLLFLSMRYLPSRNPFFCLLVSLSILQLLFPFPIMKDPWAKTFKFFVIQSISKNLISIQQLTKSALFFFLGTKQTKKNMKTNFPFKKKKKSTQFSKSQQKFKANCQKNLYLDSNFFFQKVFLSFWYGSTLRPLMSRGGSTQSPQWSLDHLNLEKKIIIIYKF